MPSIWSRSAAEQARERFWRTAPPDPTRHHKESGTPYFRPGHDRVLMPDDFMPVGEHARKHLRAVPPEYLLWVDRQLWSRHWLAWKPVSDYISRHLIQQDHIAIPPNDILYVDALRKQSHAHLHTLPGFEDLLHAFVVGALSLSRDWYQPGKLPHYDLTVNKHAQALRNGARLIDDTQLIAHKDTWIQYFKSKRQ